MRTKSVLFSIVLIALLITTVKTVRGQNTPHSSSDTDRAKRVLAVSLLGVINTTELEYKMSHGAYAARDALLASDEFKKRGTPWFAKYATNTSFSTGTEVLPGWALRLNVTTDGQGYDLLLEDTTDKTSSYAAVTDERGVIRQSKAIDCAI
ncbi:MAG TPA: hypothetical protein VJN92_03815 [Candidatus Acidoferrum sp.]|nr:hypothetical protein [Candidatus Acidoferrum sp.]